jgi:hypothetical protein
MLVDQSQHVSLHRSLISFMCAGIKPIVTVGTVSLNTEHIYASTICTVFAQSLQDVRSY